MTKQRATKRRNFIGKWIMRLVAIALLLTILPILALRWLPPPTTSFTFDLGTQYLIILSSA